MPRTSGWAAGCWLPLGPGATNALSTTLHVPASTATGSYYVLAKADWDGAVNEGVETNNCERAAR